MEPGRTGATEGGGRRPTPKTYGPSVATAEPSVQALLRRDWRDMGATWLVQWRDAFRAGSLPQDLLAGLTVAAVALPLNLALAVASGVPASSGLVAGAVGGLVAAVFGGAPMQVTGPAAALNVMVLAIATRYGVRGVAVAAVMVGLVQLLLAFSRAGHLARRVPESVLAGFTTGVGLKLLDGQLPEMLGFDYRVSELAAMMHRPEWLREVKWIAVVSGLFVAFLVVSTRHLKRFPAAIVGVGLVTFVASYVHWDIARVGDIPSHFPAPSLPLVRDDQWLDLFLAALPLGVLAAVESLLSASAVDRMAPERSTHHPSLELFGQGVANVAVGFMSGMPVSGVVVRSGLNVQSGARTRLASIAHAGFLAVAVLFASQHIAKVPLAALAGLLCVIGARLVELRTFVHLARKERLEAVAFAVTCLGTVTGHLMMGLGAGIALHAVNHFLHRGENAERVQIAHEHERGVRATLPRSASGARALVHAAPASSGLWLPNVRSRPVVAPSAFVHPQAALIGRVVLGENVHVAAGASVRADEGAPFFIGADSNIQDGVVIHALKEKRVLVGGESWAVYVGRNVSMAHDALVHGPCFVGDDTFIGFKAVVHDSVVGRGCFVGIGAVVVGVEVPDGRFVPHGSIIDSQQKVDALPLADEAQRHFNEDVVDVNRGLAAAYRAAMVRGVGGAPRATEAATRPWEPAWRRARAARF
jgi:SulP family sulfate permease